MRRPRPRRAGFTLIEISVVVVIAALLVTTATVNLDRVLPSSRGESAARELLSTFDLARTSAVAQGRTYTVEILLEEDRYRILLPTDADGRPARAPEDRAALEWHRLPDGVHFAGVQPAGGEYQERGVYRLDFDLYGGADELYIHLDNEAGEGYALTARVIGLTGQAQVIQGHALPPLVSEADF
ncbi:MAG: prepilin-type N-terminal cleavage/methylation domain-containing protein [Planctomycetota bacterium]|nr:MAG: prepilin-type N-terminal cleavage/methylation domain-containing protein [Planctomycetota bacterium]